MQPLDYTIPEAATLLNCGRDSIYHEIKQKRLRPVKLGKKTLIPHEELMRYRQERFRQQHGECLPSSDGFRIEEKQEENK